MSQIVEDEARLEITRTVDHLHIAARGDWTRENVAALNRRLEKLITDIDVKKQPSSNAVISLKEMVSLDTFGAYLISAAYEKLEQKGFTVSKVDVAENHAPLLEEVFEAAKIKAKPVKQRGAFLCFIDEVVLKGITGIGSDFHSFLSFLGLITASFLGMLIKPSRFNLTSFVHHVEFIGFRAVPIISLICFLIGAVIMQQGIVQLARYGIESKAVGSSALLFLREVAVLLTAILVAGRSSSAFTAEIGSMKMREEIDAMTTLGIDPIDTLVMPRIFALLIMLPILVFIGDLACLLGGGLMANIYLGMSMDAYLEELHKWITLHHFFAGMIKTPFIAVAIGIVGCVEGLKVEGSAESLGGHVTSAVVKSIFLVMILDGVFAIMLSAINF